MRVELGFSTIQIFSTFPKNNHNLGQNNDILSFPKFGPHSPFLENLKFRGKSTGPFPC